MRIYRKFTASVLAVTSLLSVNAFAEKLESGDPVLDYIYAVRFAFFVCSQDSYKAIVDAQYEGILKGVDPRYDFSKARACRSEEGAIVTEMLRGAKRLADGAEPAKGKSKGAKKVAIKDTRLAEEITKLQEYWEVAMTSSAVPGGSDTEESFKKKRREINLALKEMGNKLLSVHCKSDFGCIEKKGEKLSGFDRVI